MDALTKSVNLDKEGFWYVTPQTRIQILKRIATPAVCPYVERAYGLMRIGDRAFNKRDQDEKARQVLEIASALADCSSPDGPEPEKKEAPFSLPESSVLIGEALKPMLPRVNEIRRELWGSDKAPFLIHPAKALRWLEKAAAEQNAPIDKKREDTRAQSEALMQKIGELMREYERLTGYQIGIQHGQGISVLIAGKDHAKRDGVITFAGTSLAKLWTAAKELSADRAFIPSAIVRFIMTGIRPVFLTYHMTARKEPLPNGQLRTTQIKLDLWRPLNKGEMDTLYFEIKAAFGKRDKTFLKENNRRLYELVEKHGGTPQKDRAKFWTMIMKEWNARNSKSKYRTANGPRIAYKRILSRAQ